MKALLLTLAAIFIFCAIHAQKTTTLRIDPEYAKGGSASEVLDSVDIIPLETIPKSIFGRIDQLEVTDQYFVILDISTSSILIFNKTGNYQGKISTGGEVKNVSHFSIDKSENLIVLRTNADNSLYFFDFSGKLIRKEICPKNVAHQFLFPNNTIVYNIYRPGHSLKSKDTTLFDIAYSFGLNKVKNELLPYNPKYAPFDYNEYFPFYSSNGSCLFSMPYDYTIYHLADTGLIAQYKLVFPANSSLPRNFATDSIYTGKRVQYTLQADNFHKILLLENLYLIGDNLIFSTNFVGPFTRDMYFTYNLKSRNLISFGRIGGDISSYFLPIGDPFSGERILGQYRDYLYCSIPAFILLSNKEDILKSPRTNAKLTAFLQKNDRLSNPVIIRFKLKQKL